jgi:carboxyl-terminal processing protease
MMRTSSRYAAPLLVCFSLLLAGCSESSDPDVTGYVTEALDFIEENALHVDSIDWDSVRRDTFDTTSHAASLGEVYDDLARAVAQAGGKHSLFLSPGHARVMANPDLAPSPKAAIAADGVVRLIVPAFHSGREADLKHYIAAGLRGIADSEPAARCGWIIDLRGNTGGNMWPMLAVVSAFFPSGATVGGFQDRRGKTSEVTVEPGRALLDGKVLATGDDDGVPALAAAPVAILQDRWTGSSGEIVGAAFDDRARTSSFGVPSAGYLSGNITREMPDGALIVLTHAHVLDAAGEVLSAGPIIPDVMVQEGSGDPLEMASGWLGSQCDE